ncbi:hypothetical protein BDV29DRAFT_151301 [Aspergillus leporis]|jgi:hypothetical protein|uniref:Uncharacterized protein n=1 Tax=Aspergillus leporis TaxID=41062 RepID=A0A5N5WV88_9EURO|nr:hypothetical protein BDV29DRAFT_151301 [Aspergillus leporis]
MRFAKGSRPVVGEWEVAEEHHKASERGDAAGCWPLAPFPRYDSNGRELRCLFGREMQIFKDKEKAWKKRKESLQKRVHLVLGKQWFETLSR